MASASIGASALEDSHGMVSLPRTPESNVQMMRVPPGVANCSWRRSAGRAESADGRSSRRNRRRRQPAPTRHAAQSSRAMAAAIAQAPLHATAPSRLASRLAHDPTPNRRRLGLGEPGIACRGSPSRIKSARVFMIVLPMRGRQCPRHLASPDRQVPADGHGRDAEQPRDGWESACLRARRESGSRAVSAAAGRAPARRAIAQSTPTPDGSRRGETSSEG